MKVTPGTRVNYVKGCNVTGNELDEIRMAVRVARKSDVAIVVLGENERKKEGKKGTSGEGYDVATLELTGLQERLIREVHATGTPLVAVLINGRPLATPWIAEHIPSVIEAWVPGEKGGEAIAEILFGEVNPSGKLPVTLPRHAGQLPVYYNHKPSKHYWLTEGWGNPYADLDPMPLYPFGHGLSYTQFEYSDLYIDPQENGPLGTFRISMRLTNSGTYPGAEVVQLYIRDRVSTVITPVKQLKGFRKIWLEPGKSRTLEFLIGPDELKLLDKDLNWVVEPGDFIIMIGGSSEDIKLKGSFSVVDQSSGI